MIEKKKILAIIPARGGSKSIPQKNIAEFNKKPLIAWTIELAKSINQIDKVVVSTDDIEIEKISRLYGAEVVVRPVELASDNSLVISAIQHTIHELEKKSENYDHVILLEATSPLRTESDIIQCINLLYTGQFDSIATFNKADLNPMRAWKIQNGVPSTFIEGAIPWLPRQKLPIAYQLNGAVYISKVEDLKNSGKEVLFGKIGAVIMPSERSVDIDNQIDFWLAEIIKKNQEI